VTRERAVDSGVAKADLVPHCRSVRLRSWDTKGSCLTTVVGLAVAEPGKAHLWRLPRVRLLQLALTALEGWEEGAGWRH
jgi:hypothetical protein